MYPPCHRQSSEARVWVKEEDKAHRPEILGPRGVDTPLLSRLLARILFDSGASQSFIVASRVNVIGLKVESLGKLLHVSSPLETRVSVDRICWDFKLGISRILLTVDIRVMDMSEFDVILGMD